MATTKTLTFDLGKYSNKRSAAMSLAKEFRNIGSENPIGDAWDYVNKNFGKSIEKVSIEPKNQTQESLNENARKLLAEGFSISQVAKALSTKFNKPISYQRIKNVVKRLEKKQK